MIYEHGRTNNYIIRVYDKWFVDCRRTLEAPVREDFQSAFFFIYLKSFRVLTLKAEVSANTVYCFENDLCITIAHTHIQINT